MYHCFLAVQYTSSGAGTFELLAAILRVNYPHEYVVLVKQVTVLQVDFASLGQLVLCVKPYLMSHIINMAMGK